MNKLRIFVDFAVTPEVLELLQAGTRGHQLIFPRTPVSSVLARAERDPQFATVDVAFGQPEPEAITEAGQLKWIHISTSGITRYDNLQFRALTAERKIPVTNSASVYNEACAIHVLSFMVAQARKLPLALKTRAASGTKAWKEIRGTSGRLRGETVLILGYGAIGKRLAELLRPFDMKLMAYRRKPRGDESVPMITQDRLADALAAADHVVNILPDSASTRHFFDDARFAMIKPGAVFYNIGRGTTVNQDALLEMLRSGRIGAAWLDVTEPEPLPDEHPLRKEPSCFITPHVAGGHTGETKTLVRHFLTNFERFVRGEPLLDRVM
ncbi:MAG TPA: D-2-hydroxyacid dehydrogenase [Verrucomicrobiae bacterium]|nr:D-2-hydroxyacid dehydrogenase [Verrucomicrobiae bacterium]